MNAKKAAPYALGLAIAMIIGLATFLSANKSRSSALSFDAASNSVPKPETGLGDTAHATSPIAINVSAHSNRMHETAEELSPEDRDSYIAAQIAKLDDKFRGEPVDRAWAEKHEKMIAKAILGTPTDNFPVPMPKTLDEQCRSGLCRIMMTYTDEEDALQMQAKLTLGLGGAISRARSFYLPTKDGGMQLIVYAGNESSLH